MDAFTGGSGSNTFTALVGATGGATTTDTLNASDVLKGGTGTNVLNITNSATNTDVTNAAQISGIQTVNIRAASGVTSTFNASLDSGATTVNANQGAGAVTVTNLATGAAIGVIGNGTVLNGTTSYAYKTAATAQTINISGGTTGGAITNTSSAGSTTATINSTGAANTVGNITLSSGASNSITSLTVNAATDLTAALVAADYAATAAVVVSGAAANVDLSGTPVNVATVDASGLTAGGLDWVLGTDATSFKGGAGGTNVVTSAAVATTTAGAINGGSGNGDTLIVATSTDINSAAKGAVYTGFEVLQTGAVTQDVSLISGITSLKITGASILSNLTAAQAGAITVTATDATGTIGLANTSGTNDTVALTVGTSKTAAHIDITALTIAGVENLTVTTVGQTVAAAPDVLSFAAGTNALATITLSGAHSESVDLANVGATLTSLNASGVTGTNTDGSTVSNLTLTDTGGSALGAGLVITGSAAGKDSINLSGDSVTGTGLVTINGGSGASTFTLSTSELDSSLAGSFKVAGGSSTSDTLAISNSAPTMVDAMFKNVTGIEKMTVAGGAGAISITTGGYFDTNFAANGLTATIGASQSGDNGTTINFGSTTDKMTVTDTSTAVNGHVVISAGNGADTVTVTANSLTTGDVTINAGTGANTISVTDTHAATAAGTPQVIINAGTGVDNITLSVTDATVANNEVNVNIGTNSSVTAAAYDTVKGFYVGAGATRDSDKLTLDGSASFHAAITSTAVSGNTSSQLAFAVDVNGMLTFTGTATTGLTTAQADAQAIASYKSSIETALSAHNVVAFDDGTNTFVFQHSATGTDTVVELVGVTGLTHITTTAATATAHYLVVA